MTYISVVGCVLEPKRCSMTEVLSWGVAVHCSCRWCYLLILLSALLRLLMVMLRTCWLTLVVLGRLSYQVYDMIRFDYAFRGGCKRMYVSTSPHFQLCEPVPIARALCDVATERLCGVVLIPSTTVHINEISCCTAEQCCWWC